MSNDNELHGKKFKGTAYARKFGTNDPFRQFSNMTELTTSSKSEKDELKSTAKENHGQAIDIDTSQSPTEISIKSNTYNKEMMARILMGEAVDLSTGVISFADKEIIVSKGGWIKLAHADLDKSTLAFTDSKSNPIEPTNYKVNENLGMVWINETSELKDGSTITYTGKTKGRKGFAIEANTIDRIDLEMYVDLQDRISGLEGILEIPHLVLSADGDFNWFDDKWLESGMKGSLVSTEMEDGKKRTMKHTQFSE